MKAVSLQPLFDPPGGDKSMEFAMATEGALMLLIWGEVRAGPSRSGQTCCSDGVDGVVGVCVMIGFGVEWM